MTATMKKKTINMAKISKLLNRVEVKNRNFHLNGIYFSLTSPSKNVKKKRFTGKPGSTQRQQLLEFK